MKENDIELQFFSSTPKGNAANMTGHKITVCPSTQCNRIAIATFDIKSSWDFFFVFHDKTLLLKTRRDVAHNFIISAWNTLHSQNYNIHLYICMYRGEGVDFITYWISLYNFFLVLLLTISFESYQSIIINYDRMHCSIL